MTKTAKKKIALLCATNRGLRVLQSLQEICADCEISVFTFKEKEWEPRFVDDIAHAAASKGCECFVGRDVLLAASSKYWRKGVDLVLAVNWRYMLPMSLNSFVSRGIYIFHDALLPKYRGFSPLIWAMMNGETTVGATLFEMSENVDEGRIVDQEPVAIGAEDYVQSVMDRMTTAYLTILQRNIAGLLSGTVSLAEQDHSQATYTAPFSPDKCRINWQDSARNIYNLVRAVAPPYPGAYTHLTGLRVGVLKARIIEVPDCAAGQPGQIVGRDKDGGVVIRVGDGAISIDEVSVAGCSCVPCQDIFREGVRLG